MTADTFLYEPIRYLSHDYDVYLISNLKSGGSLQRLTDFAKVIDVDIYRNISIFSDICALFALFKLFRKYQFEIVHSVTPKAGLLAMTASYFAGIKTRVHTFTGQVWATKTGLKRVLLKFFDRLISFFSTHLLADSPSQLDFLIREHVVSSKKASVLNEGSISGVNVDRFKMDIQARKTIRNGLFVAASDVVFLFIGRLNREKGILDLARAFDKVANQHNNARLLIVGVDESGLRSEINEITSAHQSKVNFIDFTATPEAFMSAADVLCLPSYREGFGNVIIEAAAVGIPTIASRIYGVSDAVVDGKTGILFEVKDVNALQKSMETMIEDDKLRAQLGKAAHTRALESFSAQQLSKAWLRYYQGLS